MSLFQAVNGQLGSDRWNTVLWPFLPFSRFFYLLDAWPQGCSGNSIVNVCLSGFLLFLFSFTLMMMKDTIDDFRS